MVCSWAKRDGMPETTNITVSNCGNDSSEPSAAAANDNNGAPQLIATLESLLESIKSGLDPEPAQQQQLQQQIQQSREKKSKEQLAEIARTNGARSRGPTSEAGKRISSCNSMKHGLTSSVLLTEEHREEFEELYAIWRDQLNPGSPAEERLVRNIAMDEFRRDRSILMQTSLIDYEADTRGTELWATWPSLDAAGLISVAFRDAHRESSAFELLLRYETAHERSIARNIRLFIQLQDRRLEQGDPPPDTAQEPLPPSPDAEHDDDQPQTVAPTGTENSETNPAPHTPNVKCSTKSHKRNRPIDRQVPQTHSRRQAITSQ
jgi:hypothetical protein